MHWLLHDDVLRQLREVHKRASISTEQVQAYIDRAELETAERGPRSLRLAGDVAEIRVEGVLTKRPDVWAWIFGLGNTSYVDLLESIAMARSNADVKTVQLFVDSPGGAADGLFDVIAALQELRADKPVRVRAENAFSAAYGIAAAAGPITATTPASMFGSVGVAVRYARWTDMEVHDITNTESPDKRPDPATPEGQTVIRRELDDVFDLFAEAIALGRSASTGETVTRNDIAQNFGRGASFVAKDAKRRGMIDTMPKSTVRPALRVMSDDNEDDAGSPETLEEEETMAGEKKLTIEELRAQHIELYNEVFNAGRASGVTAERDRVEAHLEMGQMSGAPEAGSGLAIAVESISSGAEMSQKLIAKYSRVAMNRRDRNLRQQETDDAGKIVDGAAAVVTPTADLGDQVVAILQQQGGL